MGEGLNLQEEFYDLPLLILGPSTRRLLSIHLDPPAVIPTSRGVLGDLSGLAELAGFEFCHIRFFDTKPSRTIACLEEWGSRQSGTIGNMLKNLITMERFDCLAEIKESVLRDIKQYVERVARKKDEKKINTDQIDKENNIISVGSVDSDFFEKSSLDVSLLDDDNETTRDTKCSIKLNKQKTVVRQESKGIYTSDEVISVDPDINSIEYSDSSNVRTHSISVIYEDDGFLTTDDREGNLKNYRACICCADENLDLASTIMQKYKKEHDTDFFVPQEALLGGRYEFESLAEVIETRCDSRVIVILSKHYVNSPACVFATQFVKTLDPAAKSRKIIPILLDEDVSYPRVLRGISSIKARRLKYGNGFWNLLSSSLRVPKLADDGNSLVNTCNGLNMNKLSEQNEETKEETETIQNKVPFLANIEPKMTLKYKEQSSCTEATESPLMYSSVTSDDCDSGVSCGASGTSQDEPNSNRATENVIKKKNPGLRTLRRIMKSLNIIERKPKLQFTKRSHSTGETMETSPAKVFAEPRSHSTSVPPVMSADSIRSNFTEFLDAKPAFNICHNESQLTLKDYTETANPTQTKLDNSNMCSTNNFNQSCNGSLANSADCCIKQNITNQHDEHINAGQNILSPNIDPISSRNIPFDCNDLESTSRQTSYENNNMAYSRSASFDNTSLLSEITNSDNNSVVPSRKTSVDNYSVASSFRQMSSGSSNNSRQTSFDSNSRQPSIDRNSLTSVEDNTSEDKHKSFCNEKDPRARKQSEVMFEIML